MLSNTECLKLNTKTIIRKRYFAIMRIITIAIIFFFLQINAKANGQDKLTLEFKNTGLVKALNLIEEKKM